MSWHIRGVSLARCPQVPHPGSQGVLTSQGVPRSQSDNNNHFKDVLGEFYKEKEFQSLSNYNTAKTREMEVFILPEE